MSASAQEIAAIGIMILCICMGCAACEHEEWSEKMQMKQFEIDHPGK